MKKKCIISGKHHKWLKGKYLLLPLIMGMLLSGGCSGEQIIPQYQSELSEAKEEQPVSVSETGEEQPASVSEQDIPVFSGEPYVVLNDNMPEFEEWDSTEAFEAYSELDELGRCQAAYANICLDIMPTEPRGEIGMVKPSGWHTVKYDFVDGKYLFNRCHLIGYQLSGENANERNLITGTRYMNVEGMLPFENLVADYVEQTMNHVLYRVTPVYDGDNLVADGVKMEGWSVEDEGEGICFSVFVYNCQPGVVIDYATGESRAVGDAADIRDSGEKTDDDLGREETDSVPEENQESAEYILNTNTHKFHLPDCSSAEEMKPQNKAVYYGTKEELTGQGYEPCGRCNP